MLETQRGITCNKVDFERMGFWLGIHGQHTEQAVCIVSMFERG